MSALESVLRQPVTLRLGWTLAHFLWQGTLIAAAYGAARGIGGRFLSARGRYAIACAALAAMMAAPPTTFMLASFVAAAPAGWALTAGPAWERALPWLVVIWVAGVTFFSVRLISGWRVALRLRRVAVAAVPTGRKPGTVPNYIIPLRTLRRHSTATSVVLQSAFVSLAEATGGRAFEFKGKGPGNPGR